MRMASKPVIRKIGATTKVRIPRYWLRSPVKVWIAKRKTKAKKLPAATTAPQRLIQFSNAERGARGLSLGVAGPGGLAGIIRGGGLGVGTAG